MAHIDNGILLSHKKNEIMPLAATWMDLEIIVQSIVKERQRQIYDITYAAAAAKSLQSCPTLCDPIDGSPPGSPSLGFSRQEHWNGLPFPSPMHESEK